MRPCWFARSKLGETSSQWSRGCDPRDLLNSPARDHNSVLRYIWSNYLDQMCKQKIRENQLLRTTRNFVREFAQDAVQNTLGTVLQTNKLELAVRSDWIEGRGPQTFGQINFSTTTGNFDGNPGHVEQQNTPVAVLHTNKRQTTSPERTCMESSDRTQSHLSRRFGDAEQITAASIIVKG